MDTSSQPQATNQPSKEEDPRLVQANKLYQTGVMLIYGKRKSVDKAIKCIQKAITYNDADYRYWQILGEAYYQRGSLNPAINCFMRSLKLAEDDETLALDETEQKRRRGDCTYSRLRMSDIRLSVGHLGDAALGYGEIITADPNNVAALVGLSRTELQSARNNFSTGLVKSGHSHCMLALKYSLRAIKLCSHLCLTWKLASDCCLIQFVHGQRDQFTAKIEEEFPGSEDNILIVNRRVCIELAQQFLCKALDIGSFRESGCLWHNLGISLYFKSSITQKPMEREDLLKRSIKCLLKALEFDRNNSQVKNSIGVVAMILNLFNTSQNFLIKSIQSNLSTSEIQFSNLGYMYLQKGEFELASVAFARCQAEEPLYSRSWLGMALINQQKNLDNLSHLTHCHRLENNYESQLMFATKVTSLPCSEDYKRDLINALDCMKRIINYDSESLAANNTLGLLYERCNYKDQSRMCFEKAHDISNQDSRVIFNKLRQHDASKSCFSNDSIMTDGELIKAAEKLVHGGNREYLLNYIFYLFSNRDFKNVNSKMTKFMDKLPQNDVRNKTSAQILLGLAAKAEGSDFKSWLFKNIIDLENIVCIEAVINLLCLMLLGAVIEDTQLVEQISEDLSKHLMVYIASKPIQLSNLLYSFDGQWIRLVIFCSIFCLKDQSKLIRPLLALFPMLAELWLYMGLALMFQKNKQQTAVFCIKKASLIESPSASDLGVICDILLSILSSKAKLKPGTLESRTKYLSRAKHKYPSYGLLWTMLIKADTCNQKERSKNDNQMLMNEDDLSLFQLAIDHTVKMIVL